MGLLFLGFVFWSEKHIKEANIVLLPTPLNSGTQSDGISTAFSIIHGPPLTRILLNPILRVFETRVSESQRRLEEDDGDRDRGVPRRYYVLAFIVGFFILFGLFSLILYGAAKPQKPKITVKSITFETLKIQAGQDAGGHSSSYISAVVFRFRLSSPALSIDISDALSVDSGVNNIYYFCQAPREDYFQRAKPYKVHPTTARMQKLAKDLSVVMPVSFFEKSHIPDGPGESSLGLESTRLSFDDIFSILQLYVGIYGFPRQLYCFIPLPLALNLKTRDWIRVIIGGVFPAGANVVSY
ncbi:hypothetical protein F2Q69_00055765 [Brassica cretica]|uniref:Uncharacterized protein n=1 Tax=Brassica cretica TaxID=69181 RepID=A0A8S9NBE5_BRACR|nr:hypothetical protein F2Q69_00055765 [Brassica cretica]